jgi:HK97 family phage major capsid protein
LNTSCTTGTGSSQPNGVVTASTLGKTAASATAITFAEVLDLKHSLDPAYRVDPSFGFMMNDAILVYIKKLAIGASDARSLWMPSYVAGEPDRIDGVKYWINQAMETALTTGKKVMLCGDFSKYIIRMSQGMAIYRMNELYSENGLIGFRGVARWDGECINTAAIKHLITA